MALAQRRERPLKCSDARTVFRNELTACLTLVAPVGMDEEARRDWFAVAWDALKDIPPDILRIGAAKARLYCDHPSKIVPAIHAETAEMMSWKRSARIAAAPDNAPRLEPPEYCSPEEASEILKQFGLKPNPAAPESEPNRSAT